VARAAATLTEGGTSWPLLMSGGWWKKIAPIPPP
jgi:hypothetical protein